MSFTFNQSTDEWEVHGTVSMFQFEKEWKKYSHKPIHIFGDGTFNFSDRSRQYKLRKVIIDDKGRFHANFLSFDGMIKGSVIDNNGNCDIGCGSFVNGIKNRGIMIVSNSQIENVENCKCLSIKSRSIGYRITNLERSCLKTAGSIVLDSWAHLNSKIWRGNTIFIGCNNTIIDDIKYENKLTHYPYSERNYISLAEFLDVKDPDPEQLLFTRIAYFVGSFMSNKECKADPTSKSDKTNTLDDIEKLINKNPDARIPRVLASRLLINSNLHEPALSVMKTTSISGYGFVYPKGK